MAQHVIASKGLVPAALMLIQLQLGHHAVPSCHGIDAVWLIDAAVDVQQQLICLCSATLQTIKQWSSF